MCVCVGCVVSFAFLLRKTKPAEYDSVLRMVLDLRHADEEMDTGNDALPVAADEATREPSSVYDQGRAQLLFETVRGVKTQFNSTVEPVLERVLFFARDSELSPGMCVYVCLVCVCVCVLFVCFLCVCMCWCVLACFLLLRLCVGIVFLFIARSLCRSTRSCCIRYAHVARDHV
jgi:hypothetical protein